MTDTDAFSNLKRDFEDLAKTLNGIYKELPQYLKTEILHPKKKPRGSIRRARQGRLSE